jgi:hypothetical protein
MNTDLLEFLMGGVTGGPDLFGILRTPEAIMATVLWIVEVYF